MNIVESAEISGFWGDRTVSCALQPDVNFLIGANGSGKTTVINLLAAALQGDFSTLDRFPFKSISIGLKEVGGRRKPSILVTKRSPRRASFQTVEYQIRNAASEPPRKYSLDEYEHQKLLRRMYAADRHLASSASIRRRRMTRGVVQHLRQLVSVNWLSIHRSTFNRLFAEEDESYESTVDKKIEDLGDGLVRYFSSISRMRDELLADFQQQVFLSLIDLPKDSDSTPALEFESLREGLTAIYEQFGVDTKTTLRKLDQYFSALTRGIDSIENKDFDTSWRELVAAITAPRVAMVVREWWALQDRQARVEESRTKFLSLINGMLQNKALSINDNNELEVATTSGIRLTPRQLSSGEKQLLIILGDALLQRGKPYVYIADEPELSLHVDWQEALIRTLREINPQAQVIVATHSPDIVGDYAGRTINMSNAVS
ncbi:AAA family ATPase [Lentisalinibacter sediminis]|uniref:AAA family ATPase n=1 Tax=Lentisalinibacter sediminis TaxID=2992237 RepID=UPI003862F676